MRPLTPDFRFPARRGRLRMASPVMAGVTQQGNEKNKSAGAFIDRNRLNPSGGRVRGLLSCAVLLGIGYDAALTQRRMAGNAWPSRIVEKQSDDAIFIKS